MAEVINLYEKRWEIETAVRDLKENRFGMDMAGTHTTSPGTIHHNVA